MNDEEKEQLRKELGLASDGIRDDHDGLPIPASWLSGPDDRVTLDRPFYKDHPIVATGISLAFLVNLGIILSLPPVLRGRGAPYLPTRQKNMDVMFAQLRKELNHNSPGNRIGGSDTVTAAKRGRIFVDLGSGDGRLVFRAAREGMFSKCIGYEINPLLYGYAQTKRLLLSPWNRLYWSSTSFYAADIWKVDLREADVVAVYGLGPIMDKLGEKLQNECRPGSYILSNIFTLPGWRPIESSPEGTHIYKVPQGEISNANTIEGSDEESITR